MNDPIVNIEGKQFYKLFVKAGYYPYMIARDYLGNANAFNQIIRATTAQGLTAESSKTLKAGEILYVPVIPGKKPNPTPSPVPTNPNQPNTTPDTITINTDSNMMLYYLLGAGVLAFFLMKKKKRK